MYQVLSRFTVLQAMGSWAGPGNEAKRIAGAAMGFLSKTMFVHVCETLMHRSKCVEKLLVVIKWELR